MKSNNASFQRSAAVVTMALAALCQPSESQAAEEWLVVGRQGLVQVVVVPVSQAADLAAYRSQIAKLCTPDTTCFINFFSNSSGAKAELPLPDAISAEAVARFRRSTKNGVEVFQWSCRLGLGVGECF